MKKATVVKTWLSGLAVLLAAGAVASIATVAWLGHVAGVTADGSSYQPDSFFWTTVVIWWAAGLAAVAGIAIQVAAWIGAVMNTHRLADKTWFNVLLWLGIVGIVTSPVFGLGAVLWWVVTITYMIAGPDTMAVQPRAGASPTGLAAAG